MWQKCLKYTDQVDTWLSIFIIFGSWKYRVWLLSLGVVIWEEKMIEKETVSPCSWRAKSWERKSRISILENILKLPAKLPGKFQ